MGSFVLKRRYVGKKKRFSTTEKQRGDIYSSTFFYAQKGAIDYKLWDSFSLF